MMGKLPLGVVSPYVKMSSGGCADPLKFYATSYCTAYSREGFKPQVGQHKGAGYQSNYRPVINYHPSLDTLDNPAVGELIKDNAQSVFTQSYRPVELPDGRYPLPWNVYQPGSGYAREKTHSCPPSKEVKKVHFNTQDHGPQTIPGLEPKTVPVLHQRVGKGSSDMENYRYGPRFMTSEYASKYRYEVPAQPDFLQKKTIGAKEETGFTEQTIKNPIAFQPLPGDPLPPPNRSTTRADFVPMTTPHEDEYLPALAKGTERETGFSRLKEKVLPPAPPIGPPSISEPSSMSHHQYQGMQWMPQTTNAMLGRETLGAKEPSGFSTNNPGYNRGPPDPDHRFLTTYNQRYFENIPQGLDREGWTRGGIQPQQPGGYGINQPVTQHNIESYHNPTETIRRSHPHVGRTLTALDPFYRDNPHSPGFSALHAPS
ncbi:protein phosphatase 1 regulatory subunit 32 [Vombatus ursinus]|uniref:Stabilizer of axonemal microtubules 4 n=1 Tax=Vombatus ursinus TaxID=29139 RepID=A0A4X2K1N8_VOMUR|nr:protein phosphatase 1 regulatory subunit 32 [Vombatus ursinus]XP_027714708.1 protein phosphatase 1 regulatory subunit 32 [Vombatus ursinus]XP_027714709.1 protein phosphatase 1 regulatory subunit 32 [Vombatus ursinus]